VVAVALRKLVEVAQEGHCPSGGNSIQFEGYCS